MKKQFNSPVCELIAISAADVIACSTCQDFDPSPTSQYSGNPIIISGTDPLDPVSQED